MRPRSCRARHPIKSIVKDAARTPVELTTEVESNETRIRRNGLNPEGPKQRKPRRIANDREQTRHFFTVDTGFASRKPGGFLSFDTAATPSSPKSPQSLKYRGPAASEPVKTTEESRRDARPPRRPGSNGQRVNKPTDRQRPRLSIRLRAF
jgi:hypothetical protein